MKLGAAQIEAVKRSGLLDSAANNLFGDELHDFVYDALVNTAPEVKSFTAEQDKGAYSVVIRGVPGAYFVEAAEYDDDGVFDDLASAESALYWHFGEFLIDGS
jgi:hypothetical protein